MGFGETAGAVGRQQNSIARVICCATQPVSALTRALVSRSG